MPLDSWRNYTETLDTRLVPPDVVQEMLRQAEMRQEAIFRAALGMDQRASILAGGFAAAAGALATAALGELHASFRLPTLFAALFLAAAAGLCAFACRPQPFRFPGNPPNDWAKQPSYLKDHTLDEILLAHVARLQNWMHINEQRQKENGRYVSIGLFCAAIGPVVAVLVAAGRT